MLVCKNCGAMIINENKLKQTEDEEFEFITQDEKHKENMQIEYYICPKCKFKNVLDIATNQ